MVQRTLAAIAQALRGIVAAVRARAKIVLAVTAAVSVFNLGAPVIILSIARRPMDFFSFNPWLRRLPEYLASEEPLAKKLSFLSNMAIAWMSADNENEGIEWGFVVDVPTLLRILLTSLVFGAYFALWSYRKREGEACGVGFKAARPAGAIARHATVRKSGRVGRTAAAKEMEERPLILAVVAAVRHGNTLYDEFLMSGMERSEAREAVRGEVDRVLAGWREGK